MERRLALAVMLAGCGSSSTMPADAGGEPVTVVVLDHAHIGSNPAMPDYQAASAPLPALPAGTFQRATLVLDLATTCFPFSGWANDPPPAGHNFPPSCDAFDRLWETSLVDAANPTATGLELVRAVTPFGGPMHVEQDVTDVINARPTALSTLAVRIDTAADPAGKVTGSRGGWTVSAHLELVAGPPPAAILAVIPIRTGFILPATPPLASMIPVPAGGHRVRVEVHATGHGAGSVGPDCIGPADEFCKRPQQLTVDGVADAFTPWRDDCASLCTIAHDATKNIDYCTENPTGLPASVRAPRAGWCPGSVAAPHVTTATPAGTQLAIGYAIPGLPSGASWDVSVAAFIYVE